MNTSINNDILSALEDEDLSFLGDRKNAANTNSTYGKFFYLKSEPNIKVDNIYRVLPPMHSCKDAGKYAVYHRFHDKLKGSPTEYQPKGVYFPFQCLEEKQNKVVTKRCPICDKFEEMNAKYKMLAEKGAPKDQLNEFYLRFVYPFMPAKRYFLNVVNLEGQIGVLDISYTMYCSLRAKIDEYESKGIDLTGMTAPYLNFTVMKKYKGDRDAVHQVEVYMQPQDDGSFRRVMHTIDKEFIKRLKVESRDLQKLFRTITPEDAARIAAADETTRASVIDSLIAREKEQKKNNITKSESISVSTNGVDTDTTSEQLQQNDGISLNSTSRLAQVAIPKSNKVEKNTTPFMTTQPSSTIDMSKIDLASLSDEDFLKMFK
jgi:hypothetical protein